MGKGIGETKDSKNKLGSDYRDPECQVNTSGFHFVGQPFKVFNTEQ